MSTIKYLSTSPAQTKSLAKDLAKEVLKYPLQKEAVIIGLVGDLGSGKTTFLKGFAKGLGIKEKILSPSFIIMRRFDISNSRFMNFYHIDCYRIKKPKEILALGFQEIISNPQNIISIEWADKIKKILPQKTIFLNFKFKEKNKRMVRMNFDFLEKK